MSFLTSVWNYVDALVHPAAKHDPLTAARHRAFIAPRLLGSFAALASFPVYLVFRGVPSALEVGMFGWLVAPILISYFLSRTAIGLARAESERTNAAKGRFLATMSHELRTPLNAIIGFSDMLSNETLMLDAARKNEYAKLINESGRHLLSVVDGILDMSKMETGHFEITPEPFMPARLIAGCCDLLALKARDAGVEIRTRIASDLPKVVADRRAFNQILINLISNAIKFTRRGGRVTVSATFEGTKLVVCVEDTGVGISKDDLPRLGEAFFQVRASYNRRHDGSGLGLSIVKGLVRLHGGDFDIQSRLGEGTRVSVRLPVACEGGRSVDPIKLVTERARELAIVANIKVKKSA